MASPNKKQKEVLLKLWAMNNNTSFISGFEPQKLEEYLEKRGKTRNLLATKIFNLSSGLENPIVQLS